MTPSNANTSGLEVVAFLLFNEHGHTKASTMPPADGGDVAAYEPLVTAASAQARIAKLERQLEGTANGWKMAAAAHDEQEARADRLAKVMTELMPAVRAYLMTGDVMSQSIKKNTWNPVLAHAAAALQQEG